MTPSRLAPDLVRSLVGQLAIVGILFLGTAALAAIPVIWPRAFDGYLRETPPVLTEPLRAMADALAAGQLDAAAFLALGGDERLVLYDDWLTRAPRPADAPARLVTLGGEAFFARAQRSLVCGDRDQRAGALEFFERAEDPRGAAYLIPVERWARGRREAELANGAARVRAALERR